MIRFQANNGKVYFAALEEPTIPEIPILAYTSIEALKNVPDAEVVEIAKV